MNIYKGQWPSESPCSRQEAAYDCKHDVAWVQPLFEKHLEKFLSLGTLYSYLVFVQTLLLLRTQSSQVFFFSFHLTVLYITLKNVISSSALHSFHTGDYNCPHCPRILLSLNVHALTLKSQPDTNNYFCSVVKRLFQDFIVVCYGRTSGHDFHFSSFYYMRYTLKRRQNVDRVSSLIDINTTPMACSLLTQNLILPPFRLLFTWIDRI